MVGKFSGSLVGMRSYDKDGKTQFVYDVFCRGMEADRETGLYKDACSVVSVIEERQVLSAPKYNLPVEFYGEAVNGKNGSFMKYKGIHERTTNN